MGNEYGLARPQGSPEAELTHTRHLTESKGTRAGTLRRGPKLLVTPVGVITTAVVDASTVGPIPIATTVAVIALGIAVAVATIVAAISAIATISVQIVLMLVIVLGFEVAMRVGMGPIQLPMELFMFIPAETLRMGVIMDRVELVMNVTVLLIELFMLLLMLVVRVIWMGHRWSGKAQQCNTAERAEDYFTHKTSCLFVALH